MAWDPRADSWLSGFTAGEGTFGVHRDNRRGLCTPRFVIGLHPTDAGVLRELAAAFGGHVGVYGGKKPKAVWTVGKKSDLYGLVAYFDTHPLRAQKAWDFALWREIVLLYVREGAAARETLGSMGTELQEGRRARLTEV